MSDLHVYFAVYGLTDDPAELNRRLGTTADVIWRIGERYTAIDPEAARTDNRWILSSGLDETASHREHFEALYQKLSAIVDQLPILQHEFHTTVAVSHYYFMDDPAFYLPDTLLQSYARLGIEISFNQLL